MSFTVELMGSPKVIMSNPEGRFRYFAWPSVARLQNGSIAAVASGFRLRHLCPFGKAVIAYSFDEGESYTNPAPVIDTPLDDRDAGILAYGEKNVIITSFNNTVAMQRQWWKASEEDFAKAEKWTAVSRMPSSCQTVDCSAISAWKMQSTPSLPYFSQSRTTWARHGVSRGSCSRTKAALLPTLCCIPPVF